MRERRAGEIIDLIARNPEGDLACDFTIANDMARQGLREGLASGLRSVRPIEGGVEAMFRPSAWEAVQRYVNLESQCCSFLTLHAERSDDAVIVRVTGRADAQELIRNIFPDVTGE
jgi:hypothetical protein